MPNKKSIKLLTLVLTLLLLGNISIFANLQPDKLDRAIRLFNEENFSQAMPVFKELLKEDPESAMLNFYYGASRTENGFFSEKDLNHLTKAHGEDIPSKINYYLGMQSQAQNKWNEALKYYNKFRITASKEKQDSLNLTEKIQQCYNQVNPYTLEVSLDSIDKEENDPILPPNAVNNLTEDSPGLEPNTEFYTEPKETTGEPIEFQLSNEVTYLNTSHFKTEKGKNLYQKATSLKKILDLSLTEMEKLRDDFRSASVASEREIIGKKILSFENETYQLKEEITKLLLQARNLENEYWQNADPTELEKFKSKIRKLTEFKAEKTSEAKTETEEHDSSLTIDSELLLGNTETAPVVAETENKDELIYKIQIGAYSKELPAYVERLFKKFSFIRKIENYTDENGVVVYTTGNLKSFEDAVKMKNQVRQEGIEDAFVVPYFNGKRITLEQAKKIEAEL